MTPIDSGPRFRIQTSPDCRSFASSPELIAGYHVFHRLSMPRHPPYTLNSLITFIDFPPHSDSHPFEAVMIHATCFRQKGARRLLPSAGCFIRTETEKPKLKSRQKSRRSNSINLEPRYSLFKERSRRKGKPIRRVPAERG